MSSQGLSARGYGAAGLAQTGVSAVPTLLIIAGVALMLGVGALLLARRRRDPHPTRGLAEGHSAEFGPADSEGHGGDGGGGGSD